MDAQRAQWFAQFVLPESPEAGLLESLVGAAVSGLEVEAVSLNDGRVFEGPEGALVRALLEEGRREEAAAMLLRRCLDRVASAEEAVPLVRLLRTLLRTPLSEVWEWCGLEIVLASLVQLPFRDVVPLLQLQRMLLDDPATCSCLEVLPVRFGHRVLELADIGPEEANCDLVLGHLRDAAEWMGYPKGCWALPGNGAAVRLLSRSELESLDVAQLLDEQKYVALCHLFGLDADFADAAMKEMFNPAVRRVHPVAVMALMQLRPEFEATLRARSRAWLRSSLLHAFPSWRPGCWTTSTAASATSRFVHHTLLPFIPGI
jgi:hypothetical protein